MMLKTSVGAPLLSIWWVDMLDGEPAACSQLLQSGAAVAVEVSR